MRPSANYRYRLLLAVIVTALPFLHREHGERARWEGTKPGVAKPWSVRGNAIAGGAAPVAFDVTPPARLTRLSAKWLGHQVWFKLSPRRKTWYGSPASVSNPSGHLRPVEISGTTSQATTISFTRQITVRATKYPSNTFTVASDSPNPAKWNWSALSGQDDQAGRVSHTNPEREWSGRLLHRLLPRLRCVRHPADF